MKYPKQDAERWLKEAFNTLKQAEETMRDEFYNLSCFLSEQASQKAAKAALYFFGERYATEHSIVELLRRAAKYREQFGELVGSAKILDQYYISTRYPDAVARPAIPSELFTKENAEKALNIAREIYGACESVILTSVS